MENTSSESARMIAGILAGHGVRHAVLSPGSRNAPLLVAFNRHPQISTHVVIDERSAAFVALGMSMAIGEPVVLVCTSGSAPLNYCPALAEASYRHVPLIAVTADRPARWIDQADSQTIRQGGIFTNFCKTTVDIPVEENTDNWRHLATDRINHAVNKALSPAQGPVHINVQLDAPLGKLIAVENESFRIIKETHMCSADGILDNIDVNKYKRILILAGGGYSESLKNLTQKLLDNHHQILFLAEAQANLYECRRVYNFDRLAKMPPTPDLIITIGGALVSGKLKNWVRAQGHAEHWSVSQDDVAPDTFGLLTRRFNCPPALFLEALNDKLQTCESDSIPELVDVKADTPIARLIEKMPSGWTLQVSNGTSIRELQKVDYRQVHRIECNRGVSGIDGSTSTAIGFAALSENPTLLITGDMSFLYDVGALAIKFIPEDFHIAVINNRGGDIFRQISQTSALEECEEFFAAPTDADINALSKAFGFNYLKIADLETQSHLISDFYKTPKAILEICVTGLQ